jgi:hypothetical protein
VQYSLSRHLWVCYDQDAVAYCLPFRHISTQRDVPNLPRIYFACQDFRNTQGVLIISDHTVILRVESSIDSIVSSSRSIMAHEMQSLHQQRLLLLRRKTRRANFKAFAKPKYFFGPIRYAY